MKNFYHLQPECYSKYFVIILVFASIISHSWLAFSQAKNFGSLAYLKICNGFKGVILGSDANIIPADKLTYLDDDNRLDRDSCLKFAFNDHSLLNLDSNLSLNLVAIRTYKNKIVNIYIFFKKEDGYKILKKFSSAYGIFTERPDDYLDIYNWNTRLVNLSLRYQLDTDLGVAIYTCNELEKEIESKKRKLQDVYKSISMNNLSISIK